MYKIELTKKPLLLKMRDNYTGDAPKKTTEVSVNLFDGGIRAVFHAKEDSFSVYGKNYNDELWRGDIIEIMLTLGADSKYLEIEVNPDGVKYAVLIENKDMEGDITIHKLSECPFEAETARTDSGWTSEIKFKFGVLKSLGWNPENSKINFYRQDFDENGKLWLYAVSPTYCGKFHIPRAFVSMEVNDNYANFS